MQRHVTGRFRDSCETWQALRFCKVWILKLLQRHEAGGMGQGATKRLWECWVCNKHCVCCCGGKTSLRAEDCWQRFPGCFILHQRPTITTLIYSRHEWHVVFLYSPAARGITILWTCKCRKIIIDCVCVCVCEANLIIRGALKAKRESCVYVYVLVSTFPGNTW